MQVSLCGFAALSKLTFLGGFGFNWQIMAEDVSMLALRSLYWALFSVLVFVTPNVN